MYVVRLSANNAAAATKGQNSRADLTARTLHSMKEGRCRFGNSVTTPLIAYIRARALPYDSTCRCCLSLPQLDLA
jgi:hypothetical protein